jgi:hypothetical protein
MSQDVVIAIVAVLQLVIGFYCGVRVGELRERRKLIRSRLYGRSLTNATVMPYNVIERRAEG